MSNPSNKTKGNGHPTGDILPNEIIALIITHLSNDQHTLFECTLIKPFSAIAQPLFWQTLDFRRIDMDLFVASPTTWLGYVREIHLEGPRWMDGSHLQLFAPAPRLDHLPLEGTGFQCLPALCPQLTTLTLDATRIARASFYALGRHSRLTHFYWTLSTYQAPDWLELLTCPLEHLVLTCIDSPLNPKAIRVIQTAFPLLTHLTLTHTVANLHTPDGLHRFLQHAPPRLGSLTLRLGTDHLVLDQKAIDSHR